MTATYRRSGDARRLTTDHPFAIAQHAVLDAYDVSTSAGDREFARQHAVVVHNYRCELLKWPVLQARYDDSLSELVAQTWNAWRRGCFVNYVTQTQWHARGVHRDQSTIKRSSEIVADAETIESGIEAQQQSCGRVRLHGAMLKPLVHPPQDAAFVDRVLERLDATDVRIAALRASGYSVVETAERVGIPQYQTVCKRMAMVRKRIEAIV